MKLTLQMLTNGMYGVKNDYCDVGQVDKTIQRNTAAC